MAIPDPIRRIRGYEAFRRVMLHLLNKLRQPGWRRRRMVADYLARSRPAKLNIGCGDHPLPGWLNSDCDAIMPPGALYLDAARPFPLASGSFDFIFSEHMIEHVPLAGAVNMLRECHRILRPGGRIRIATPRLEFMLELLTDPAEQHRSYADYHYEGLTEEPAVRTPARILNDYHRMWGHQFVFDEATLRLLLERAGFVNLQVEEVNESSDPHFRAIENDGRMPEGMLALTTLVLEGEKPREPADDGRR
jgi:predicted SAM-dependent methyltransferase